MTPLKSLKSALFPYNNCELSTYILCQRLNIRANRAVLKKKLIEHPSYPSLLAISDVLKDYGVKNLAIKTDVKNLCTYPLPCLAQVRTPQFGPQSKSFTVITDMEADAVHFSRPLENKEEELPIPEFEKVFGGIALLVEADEHSGEQNYLQNKRSERKRLLLNVLSATFIPLLTALLCINCLMGSGMQAFPYVLFALISLSGSYVGALLLWYEVDKSNPALQKFCSGIKNLNCNAVLNSKASKILGIKWSAIGFVYFSGSLIALLVSGIYSLPIFTVLACLSLLATPYIPFSIYYQLRVAKQWCVLCVAIQGLLALQFVTVLAWLKFQGLPSYSAGYPAILGTLLLSFALPALSIKLLLPALLKAKEVQDAEKELKRFKHDPEVFETLLVKQKAVLEPVEGMGITLGNPHAKHKLIKVCNPYCGPCAMVHPIIEDLLVKNMDLQVQIIFTALDEEDAKAPPVLHLLAISEEKDASLTRRALDDWYLPNQKDYAAFAVKYPVNGKLAHQGDKIKSMAEWCVQNKITFTPTLFVDGYQLPQMYSATDLKYFLST